MRWSQLVPWRELNVRISLRQIVEGLDRLVKGLGLLVVRKQLGHNQL